MKKVLTISPRHYVFLGALFLLAYAVLADTFQSQELCVFDAFMRTRPLPPVNKEIVIIEIADDTLKNLGRWPLPRQYHTLLIKALSESGARSIVFDILFSEPGDDDGPFAAAIEESGRVFLPLAFQLEKERDYPGQAVYALDVLSGIAPALKDKAAGTGHINMYIDPDGKLRRIPLLVKFKDSVVPALGLQVASQRLNVPWEKIPVPGAGGAPLWINYPGPWTKTFDHVSYLDVLKAYTVQMHGGKPALDLSGFKDKICFVGLTATGTSDLRATPLDVSYPLMGVQASLCDSLLRGAFVQRAAPGVRLLISAGVLLAAVLLCLTLSPVVSFAAVAGLMVATAMASWAIFVMGGYFLDVFLPLLMGGVAYVSILLYKFFLEVQRRSILEKELEIAASIQRSFLPAPLPSFSGLKTHAVLRPAKFVAGDFYDLIILDEKTLGVFIGDVSGKGISAALIMSQVISLLRILARQDPDPAKVLNALNTHLLGILKGRFVTGQYVVIHAAEGFWEGACAGHPSIFSFNRDLGDITQVLAASGPPLGLIEKAPYETVRQPFNPADKVFLYTDGWTESRDRRGREFGIQGLREVIAEYRAQNAEDFLKATLSRLDAFVNNATQHDDITAVIVERAL
jgi:adenylate cyclase